MKKFETGKTYYTRYVCDSDSRITATVISRTDKTVTIKTDDNRVKRCKIHTDENGEFIIPERYSLAPVFRAYRVA